MAKVKLKKGDDDSYRLKPFLDEGYDPDETTAKKPKLTGIRFWKWRALDAELRASSTELRVIGEQFAHELEQNKALATLHLEMRVRETQHRARVAELRAYLSHLSDKMDVDVLTADIDDVTGTITTKG